MTGRYKTSSLLHLALLARWTHTYGTISIFSEEKQSPLSENAAKIRVSTGKKKGHKRGRENKKIQNEEIKGKGKMSIDQNKQNPRKQNGQEQ